VRFGACRFQVWSWGVRPDTLPFRGAAPTAQALIGSLSMESLFESPWRPYPIRGELVCLSCWSFQLQRGLDPPRVRLSEKCPGSRRTSGSTGPPLLPKAVVGRTRPFKTPLIPQLRKNFLYRRAQRSFPRRSLTDCGVASCVIDFSLIPLPRRRLSICLLWPRSNFLLRGPCRSGRAQCPISIRGPFGGCSSHCSLQASSSESKNLPSAALFSALGGPRPLEFFHRLSEIVRWPP